MPTREEIHAEIARLESERSRSNAYYQGLLAQARSALDSLAAPSPDAPSLAEFLAAGYAPESYEKAFGPAAALDAPTPAPSPHLMTEQGTLKSRANRPADPATSEDF